MLHPKQIEGAEKRAKLIDEKAIRAETVATLRDVHNLKFVHLPADGSRDHGMSIAYRVGRRDVLTFSTALQHPNDEFSKEFGRYVAATNFDNGQAVMVRKPGSISPRDYFVMLFTGM